jgi:hypothetical protein
VSEQDGTPPADAAAERPPLEQMQRGRVVRRPKYAVFIALGVLVGLLAAGLFTLLAPPPDPTVAPERLYSDQQVLGYTSVVLGPLGGLLGAGTAVLLDRRGRRRT